MSSQTSLKVGIVGAGVAGLGAAIALRKIGHDVEVSLENSRQSQQTLDLIIHVTGLRAITVQK